VILDAPWHLSSVSRALKGFDGAAFSAKKAVDIKARGKSTVNCLVGLKLIRS